MFVSISQVSIGKKGHLFKTMMFVSQENHNLCGIMVYLLSWKEYTFSKLYKTIDNKYF